MSVDIAIANNLRLARQDLDGARLLAASANRNAIYLCEQAAEKIIKAVLTAEGKHAGIQHHLDAMVDLVPDENPLKPELRATERLAAYATAFRYVTPAGRIPRDPPPHEVQAHIARVEVALAAAVAAFQVDLADLNAPARHPAPPRIRAG